MLSWVRKLLPEKSPPSTIDDPVTRWATTRWLHLRSGEGGRFAMDGTLAGAPLHVQCSYSTRPYISGLELRARVDLGLQQPAGHVVAMSQVVCRAIVEDGQRSDKLLTEEHRWFSRMKPVTWGAVDERFWRRYAVLSDNATLARHWLDGEAQEYLVLGAGPPTSEIPLLAMLIRGRCYLRMQISAQSNGSDVLLALDMLEHLSARAKVVAGRRSRPPAAISSPE